MTRTPLIAANWKMNELPVGCCTVDSPYRTRPTVDVWVFPSFIDLHTTRDHGLVTGAQWGHPKDSGAYTGDVSIKLLADQHIVSVLCGHSERREHHHETDAFIAEQVVSALSYGMAPILCIGETADEREEGMAEEVVKRQLMTVLHHSQFKIQNSQFVIAYEPVWAIGTGKTATAAQAQQMHAFIRGLLPPDMRETTRILYGGSVKPENAKEILLQSDIDGALVGGASLDPAAFRKIVEFCKN
jgi:triosephosphate isomerase